MLLREEKLDGMDGVEVVSLIKFMCAFIWAVQVILYMALDAYALVHSNSLVIPTFCCASPYFPIYDHNLFLNKLLFNLLL
jgi:hypothetical protein